MRRGLLGGGLGLLLVACTATGPVDRSENSAPRPGDVVVRGTLVAPDQRPVSGRPVSAVRIKTGGDVFADLFITIFTYGLGTLGCLGGDGPLEVCRNGDYTTQTGAGGRFGFRFREGDLRSTGGNKRAIDISTGIAPAAGERSGPIVTVRLTPSDAKTVTLGKLPVWDGDVRATGDAKLLHLGWAKPPGSGTLAARMEAPSRGFFWSAERIGEGATLDARVLEDVSPTFLITAKGEISGRTAVWTSAGGVVAPAAGAPPSRGAACTLTVGSRTLAPNPSGCWLDDGHFSAEPRFARATSCREVSDGNGFTDIMCVRAPVTQAQLDLGTSMPVAVVLLRLSQQTNPLGTSAVVIDGSNDGSSWKRLGEWDGKTDGDHVEVVPPDGMKVRYVRLRPDGRPRPQPSYVSMDSDSRQDPAAEVTDYRGDLAALAEVSIWKGEPRRAALFSRDGSSSAEAKARATRGTLLIVAGVLALLLVGGVGFALGRRRLAA